MESPGLSPQTTGEVMPEEYRLVEIEKCVQTEDFNTRSQGLGDLTDLIESIRQQGILQPLLGKDKENGNEEVEIYAGFRRLAAAREVGLKVVPVKVVPRRKATKKVMLLANVSENIHRDNLNPVDEAYAFERLQKDHSMSTDEICRELGVKKSLVEARFRLLKLTKPVRDAVHEDRITLVAAFDIDRLPEDKQEKFIAIAEELRGGKLTELVNKELEKIQKKLDGVSTKKTKSPDAAVIAENVKRLKQANAVLCDGLKYDETKKTEVLHINFKPLDQDDLTTLTRFLDDCADKVEDEIPLNEKADEEMLAYVTGKKEDLLNMESETVQGIIYEGLKKRATEIAKEIGQQKGKRARITYAIARQAIESMFCPPDDGTEPPEVIEENEEDQEHEGEVGTVEV